MRWGGGRKEEPAKVMKLTIGSGEYQRFEAFASREDLGKNEALRRVLVKGMQSFRPQQMAELLEEYSDLRQRVVEYRKDNAVLRKMRLQNQELTALLAKAERLGDEPPE